MNITPDFYTEYDGGRWLPWTFGELKSVPSIYSTHEKTATFRAVLPITGDIIKGVPTAVKESFVELHSFAVGNPIGTPTYSYARWDSYNGWTTSPEDIATIDEGR